MSSVESSVVAGGDYYQPMLEVEGAIHNSKLNIVQKYGPKSPLRYPGGKNRAIKTITSLIPKDVTKLCSPFLGGGSIELACTTRMEVYGSDIFGPLTDFWQILLEDPDRLYKRVLEYFPLQKEEFYSLQRTFYKIDDKIERAAAFYVLNRSSFSGTTMSGGMSPGHPRFTISAINRLITFKVSNFIVTCEDYQEALERHKDAFLYLDPPYLNDQALYGVNGDTHKGFDHNALARYLFCRDRWIMSYNDSSSIRRIYEGYPIYSVSWLYGMSKNKTSNEILILSKDLEYGPITE